MMVHEEDKWHGECGKGGFKLVSYAQNLHAFVCAFFLSVESDTSGEGILSAGRLGDAEGDIDSSAS